MHEDNYQLNYKEAVFVWKLISDMTFTYKSIRANYSVKILLINVQG